jgi:hypothetical protein
MSTTTSSILNIKSRLPTSKSINNMTTNGNDTKSNRIYFKKPLSATNILQSYSSKNGYNNHLKKRTVLSNDFHPNKPTKSTSIVEKSIANCHHHNGHHPNNQLSNNTTHHPSPPTVLYAIAPTSLSSETNNDKKVFL